MSNNGNFNLPPNSLTAEQFVLGGLMMMFIEWKTVAKLLVEEDFYRREHQIVFSAMAKLINNNSTIDAITISEYIELNGYTNEIGGLDYLAELVKNTPSSANIKAYAEVVRELAVIREKLSSLDLY